MKHDKDLPRRHELDHPIPTVIHQPEPEDPTLLKQWLDTALAKGGRFWIPAAGLAVVALAVTALVAGLSDGKAEVGAAWTELTKAKTPSEFEAISREYPATPASRWADYLAARRYYDQGFNDLPANRDAALPILKKALDKFRQVATEAGKDEPVGRLAAIAAARTLESRDQLTEAIAAYKKIAADFPGTAEARSAARLAARLERPESAAFYKQLYAYARPADSTLPPLPPGHPDVNGPAIPTPGLPSTNDLFKTPFPSATPPAAPTGPASPPPPAVSEMPGEVFKPVPPAGPDPTMPAVAPITAPAPPPAAPPMPEPATKPAAPEPAPMPAPAPETKPEPPATPPPAPELPENIFKPAPPPQA